MSALCAAVAPQLKGRVALPARSAQRMVVRAQAGKQNVQVGRQGA